MKDSEVVRQQGSLHCGLVCALLVASRETALAEDVKDNTSKGYQFLMVLILRTSASKSSAQ